MFTAFPVNALIKTISVVFLLGALMHAQSVPAQTSDELIASWLVTVEGEARARVFKVQGAEQKPGGTIVLDARYGFVDGKQAAVGGEITQLAQGRKLTLTTQADSVIVATQSADGVFSGTITYKNGVVKPVKLTRTAESELAATKGAPAGIAAGSAVYAGEDKDFGVAATRVPKRPPYHASTPTDIPGGKVIKTVELKQLLDKNQRVVVIDVLDSKGNDRQTVPGAVWLFGAGSGEFYGAEKGRFSDALGKLTGGEKSRPLVFMCINAECWLSYNASLHAIDAGYSNVSWYRGGSDAWRAAKFKMEKALPTSW